MTQHPFTRPRTTLDLHAPGGLAALFGRTRAEFGGHTMTATAVEGGQQTGQEGNGQQQTAAPQAGQEQQGGQQTQQQEVEGPRDDEDAAAFLARVGPDAVAKMALRYRREAGDRRQQTLTAEQSAQQRADQAAADARQKAIDELRPVLVAAGLVEDDETPDPVKLTEQAQTAQQERDAARQETRTLKIERAVMLAAPGLQASVDRLLDSRSFAQVVASLDPDADDFGGKVKAAIEAALKKDQTLKTTRAVGSAGMPHVGGSGAQNGQQRTPVPLADAVAAAMNPTR